MAPALRGDALNTPNWAVNVILAALDKQTEEARKDAADCRRPGVLGYFCPAAWMTPAYRVKWGTDVNIAHTQHSRDPISSPPPQMSL